MCSGDLDNYKIDNIVEGGGYAGDIYCDDGMLGIDDV